MDIVDAQLHLWELDSPKRPWPEGRAGDAQRPYPISAESLLFQMDLAGVQRAVLVPPSFEGDRNDLALAAAANYPDRFAVMGRLTLDDPSNLEQLERWREQPGMLGVRLTFHKPVYQHLLEPGVADWFWSAAERLGVPLMMLMPGQMDQVDRLATAHPGLRITLDHLGIAVHDGPSGFDRVEEVCAVAKHANVAVKVSGVPNLSAEPYPFPDVHDGVKRLFDSFGPQRTFWGTDLTRMPVTYYECISLFTQHLPWLKGEDLDWVMGRGICEWLDWPL